MFGNFSWGEKIVNLEFCVILLLQVFVSNRGAKQKLKVDEVHSKTCEHLGEDDFLGSKLFYQHYLANIYYLQNSHQNYQLYIHKIILPQKLSLPINLFELNLMPQSEMHFHVDMECLICFYRQVSLKLTTHISHSHKDWIFQHRSTIVEMS